MASVNSAIAAKIILGNGIYPGDEDKLVVRVVSYKHRGNRDLTFGIVYESEVKAEPSMLFRYDETSDYISDPVVVWRHASWKIDGHAVIDEGKTA